MTRHIVLAVSVAALSLTLTTTAHAQAQAMPHFGISAGASIPESTFGESVNTGYNLNAMLNFTVPLSPLGFRFEGGLNRFDFSEGNGTGNVRVINGAANVVLTPSAVMTAKPYLIAGVGAYNVRTSIDNTGGVLTGAFTSESSDTRLGFNGGIGLFFGLGPVGSMLEARYVTVNGKNGSGSLTYIPVSFGVTF
ncbi:MAG: outer membrane beta-barrel protein [Gemmatimonadaceae bacterium]